MDNETCEDSTLRPNQRPTSNRHGEGSSQSRLPYRGGPDNQPAKGTSYKSVDATGMYKARRKLKKCVKGLGLRMTLVDSEPPVPNIWEGEEGMMEHTDMGFPMPPRQSQIVDIWDKYQLYRSDPAPHSSSGWGTASRERDYPPSKSDSETSDLLSSVLTHDLATEQDKCSPGMRRRSSLPSTNTEGSDYLESTRMQQHATTNIGACFSDVNRPPFPRSTLIRPEYYRQQDTLSFSTPTHQGPWGAPCASSVTSDDVIVISDDEDTVPQEEEGVSNRSQSAWGTERETCSRNSQWQMRNSLSYRTESEVKTPASKTNMTIPCIGSNLTQVQKPTSVSARDYAPLEPNILSNEEQAYGNANVDEPKDSFARQKEPALKCTEPPNSVQFTGKGLIPDLLISKSKPFKDIEPRADDSYTYKTKNKHLDSTNMNALKRKGNVSDHSVLNEPVSPKEPYPKRRKVARSLPPNISSSPVPDQATLRANSPSAQLKFNDGGSSCKVSSRAHSAGDETKCCNDLPSQNIISKSTNAKAVFTDTSNSEHSDDKGPSEGDKNKGFNDELAQNIISQCKDAKAALSGTSNTEHSEGDKNKGVPSRNIISKCKDVTAAFSENLKIHHWEDKDRSEKGTCGSKGVNDMPSQNMISECKDVKAAFSGTSKIKHKDKGPSEGDNNKGFNDVPSENIISKCKSAKEALSENLKIRHCEDKGRPEKDKSKGVNSVPSQNIISECKDVKVAFSETSKIENSEDKGPSEGDKSNGSNSLYSQSTISKGKNTNVVFPANSKIKQCEDKGRPMKSRPRQRQFVYDMVKQGGVDPAALYMTKIEEWTEVMADIQKQTDELKISLTTENQTFGSYTEKVYGAWRRVCFLVECLHAEMEVERMSLRPEITNKNFQFSDDLKERIGNCIALHISKQFAEIKSAIHEVLKIFQRLNHDNKNSFREYNDGMKKEDLKVKVPVLLLLNQRKRFALFKEKKPLISEMTPGLTAGLYGEGQGVHDQLRLWLARIDEPGDRKPKHKTASTSWQEKHVIREVKPPHSSNSNPASFIPLASSNSVHGNKPNVHLGVSDLNGPSSPSGVNKPSRTYRTRSRSNESKHKQRWPNVETQLVAHKASEEDADAAGLFGALFTEWEKREKHLGREFRRAKRELESCMEGKGHGFRGNFPHKECRVMAELCYLIEHLHGQMEMERMTLKPDNVEGEWLFSDVIASKLGTRKSHSFNERYLTINRCLKKTAKDFSRFFNLHISSFRSFNLRPGIGELKVAAPHMISLSASGKFAKLLKAQSFEAAKPPLSPGLEAAFYGKEQTLNCVPVLPQDRDLTPAKSTSGSLLTSDYIDPSLCYITKYDESSLKLCRLDGPKLYTHFTNMCHDWKAQAEEFDNNLKDIADVLGTSKTKLSTYTSAACYDLANACFTIQGLYTKYVCAKLSQRPHKTSDWKFAKPVFQMMGGDQINEMCSRFDSIYTSLKRLSRAFCRICCENKNVIQLYNNQVEETYAVQLPMPIEDVASRIMDMYREGSITETPLEQLILQPLPPSGLQNDATPDMMCESQTPASGPSCAKPDDSNSPSHKSHDILSTIEDHNISLTTETQELPSLYAGSTSSDNRESPKEDQKPTQCSTTINSKENTFLSTRTEKTLGSGGNNRSNISSTAAVEKECHVVSSRKTPSDQLPSPRSSSGLPTNLKFIFALDQKPPAVSASDPSANVSPDSNPSPVFSSSWPSASVGPSSDQSLNWKCVPDPTQCTRSALDPPENLRPSLPDLFASNPSTSTTFVSVSPTLKIGSNSVPGTSGLSEHLRDNPCSSSVFIEPYQAISVAPQSSETNLTQSCNTASSSNSEQSLNDDISVECDQDHCQLPTVDDVGSCECGCQGKPLLDIIENPTMELAAYHPERVKFWVRLHHLLHDTSTLKVVLSEAESQMSSSVEASRTAACKLVIDLGATLPYLRVRLKTEREGNFRHGYDGQERCTEDQLRELGVSSGSFATTNFQSVELALTKLYEEFNRVWAEKSAVIVQAFPHAADFKEKRGGLIQFFTPEKDKDKISPRSKNARRAQRRRKLRRERESGTAEEMSVEDIKSHQSLCRALRLVRNIRRPLKSIVHSLSRSGSAATLEAQDSFRRCMKNMCKRAHRCLKILQDTNTGCRDFRIEAIPLCLRCVLEGVEHLGVLRGTQVLLWQGLFDLKSVLSRLSPQFNDALCKWCQFETGKYL